LPFPEKVQTSHSKRTESFSEAFGKNKSKKIPNIFNLLKSWLPTLSNSLATCFSKTVAALSSKPF